VYQQPLRFIKVEPNSPGKVEHELLEDTLKEGEIFTAVHLALDLEDTEGCPGSAQSGKFTATGRGRRERGKRRTKRAPAG
jgi:hypothetical protein